MAEETACTVAIGDVPAWVDEKYLFQLFLPTQAVVSVRLSRVPSAAGTRTAHMTLRSHDAAAGALRAYNGHAPPGVEGWVLNMGWATEELPENQGAGLPRAMLSAHSAACHARARRLSITRSDACAVSRAPERAARGFAVRSTLIAR